ncbi:HPr family phosphocarrier protein [Paenibacillus sp. TAB 01]|uniref:HPr family phosphocarrier protein n=1 Tax=Paenibacillus sp. TAB 01 TaxID=3368988 RepID=UPI003753225F
MAIEWKWDIPIPAAIRCVIRLAEIANRFESVISFGKNQIYINGKNAAQVVSLFLALGSEPSLSFIVEGNDAGEAFRSIHNYIDQLVNRREPTEIYGAPDSAPAGLQLPYHQAI